MSRNNAAQKALGRVRASSPVGQAPLAVAIVPEKDNRDRRSADKIALVIFRGAAQLAVSKQMALLRATSQWLFNSQPEDAVEAIEALRAYERAMGRRPTRDGYGQWHETQAVSNPDQIWPSAARIATTFGNWTRAKAAYLGQPVGDVDARRLLHCPTGGFTSEQILAGVRRWWEQSDKSSWFWHDYVAWARKTLSEAAEPGLMLCLSEPTFCKHVGGWAKALEAAGVLDEIGGQIADQGKLIKSGGRYSDDDLFDALEEFLAWCDSKNLKAFEKHYAARRKARMSAALREGALLVLPSYHAMRDRWGSMAGAIVILSKARPQVVGPVHLLRAKRELADFSVEDRARAFVAAAAVLGETLGNKRYDAWRQEIEATTGEPLPSAVQLKWVFPGTRFADRLIAAREFLATIDHCPECDDPDIATPGSAASPSSTTSRETDDES